MTGQKLNDKYKCMPKWWTEFIFNIKHFIGSAQSWENSPEITIISMNWILKNMTVLSKPSKFLECVPHIKRDKYSYKYNKLHEWKKWAWQLAQKG